jgi:co-chaperonin GroES (HSP10)
MDYEPTKDNVYLLIEKVDRQTAGGIFLPQSAKNSQYGEGLVAARVSKAGPGGFDDHGAYWAVDVCQGDRVLIRHDAGERVIVGEDIRADHAPTMKLGAEVRVVRNYEILASLDEDA